MTASRKLAVITGASSGIGLELARCAAEDGCDLVIVADEPEIEDAAAALRDKGAAVEAIRADLGTEAGLDTLWRAVEARDIDYMMANAGRGLGDAFLDQDLAAIEQVIAVKVTYTTALLRRTVEKMRERGEGAVLITGSIAGLMPGGFQAVYNGTKAYLDTLSWGIREELRGSGVSVTCLMPGPTDTVFFARSGMEDTPVGRDQDPVPGGAAGLPPASDIRRTQWPILKNPARSAWAAPRSSSG